jgi:hypothetical protein
LTTVTVRLLEGRVTRGPEGRRYSRGVLVADEDVKTIVREFRTSVSADLAAAHRKIEDFKDEMRKRIATAETAILNEIRDMGVRLDLRLERVEVRLGEVEGRLGGVEGRLGEVEGRLGGVEVRLGEVEGRLGGVEGRLGP